MTHRRSIALALAFSLLAGCASAPIQTVPQVDLPRFMGDWYVIANIPYFAENGCVDSVERYALRADGNIDNWFSCRKNSLDAPLERQATALAKVKDRTTNAEWRIRFFRVISVKYLILDLDPAYQWVSIGHPSRRYGWILARSKALDAPTYDAILRRLGEKGYDIAKFHKVPQRTSPSPSG